jgi:NTP pyrophosphatase (non-canonical NTP hydrolase)
MAATLDDLTEKIERVSLVYADRCNIRRDDDWFALKLQEEIGELIAEHLRVTARGRIGERSAETLRNGLEDEATDVLAQLLLYCRHNAIDVEAALERKWFKHLQPVVAKP